MFPQNAAEFLSRGQTYWQELHTFKSSVDLPWYPFDSLSALPVVAELLSHRFDDIKKAVSTKPVLDIGCGDGDLACLFSSFGSEVDAVDSSSTNFNQMAGVRALGDRLRNIYDVDLDNRFDLPASAYGLTLFLGTLYHLKNPYYLLEKLAYKTEWCLLSTRVAQFTPKTNAPVETEPMAYLADGREINNDATNYWIFSGTGFLRILQRTRWAITATKRIGCTEHSDPIRPDRDERMFVLAQSRLFHPQLQVRPGIGWYPEEGNGWCWTAKQFTLEVVLPLETEISAFELRFYTPTSNLIIHAVIAGQDCGLQTCKEPGAFTLFGALPPFTLHEPILRVNFQIESANPGDGRELGICIALPIPFEVR